MKHRIQQRLPIRCHLVEWIGTEPIPPPRALLDKPENQNNTWLSLRACIVLIMINELLCAGLISAINVPVSREVQNLLCKCRSALLDSGDHRIVRHPPRIVVFQPALKSMAEKNIRNFIIQLLGNSFSVI